MLPSMQIRYKRIVSVFASMGIEIKNLKYGVSITDSCLDWNTTERIIRKYAEEIKKYRNTLKGN
jgi:phospho-2-dehydro-3-deoxyheptonate aldolase